MGCRRRRRGRSTRRCAARPRRRRCAPPSTGCAPTCSARGYMSTANIVLDPMIAEAPGAPNIVEHRAASMKGTAARSRRSHRQRRAGILGRRSTRSRSRRRRRPALAPDMFEIGGNMTPPSSSRCRWSCPGGRRTARQIYLLGPTSPAIYRIAASGLGTPRGQRRAAQRLPAGRRRACRRSSSCACSTTPGTPSTSPRAPWPPPRASAAATSRTCGSTRAARRSSTAAQTGTAGRHHRVLRGLHRQPVQIVRWEISSAATEAKQTNQAQYASGARPAVADLRKRRRPGEVRPRCAPTWTRRATPVTQTSEVDRGVRGRLEARLLGRHDHPRRPEPDHRRRSRSTTRTTPCGRRTSRLTRAGAAERRAAAHPLGAGSHRHPPASQADRTVNVPVTNFGAQEFVYRYCVNATPSCATVDQTLRWARARTMTTEVSLSNSAQDFF